MDNVRQVLGNPSAALSPRVRMRGDAPDVFDLGSGPHGQRETDGNQHLRLDF